MFTFSLRRLHDEGSDPLWCFLDRNDVEESHPSKSKCLKMAIDYCKNRVTADCQLKIYNFKHKLQKIIVFRTRRTKTLRIIRKHD